MPGFFSKERIVAPAGFNRWRVLPASIGIQMCIGSVYAWSIYNPALTKVLGVAAASADDWTLSEVARIFAVSVLFLGLAAMYAGKWLETVGPRTVGILAASCWGGGHLIGSLGIFTHQLWLVYLGYGVVGGCGLGLGYVSPVSMLIRWFPDRRGLATGLAIMGFGGGAIVGAPLKEHCLRTFYQAPDYLGTVVGVDLLTSAGRRFVEIGGQMREVVVVGSGEVGAMIVPGPPGVYLAGTGSVGAGATFLVLGLVYFTVMFLAALNYRIPGPNWKPEGWTPPSPEAAAGKMMTNENVHIDQALRTPQFYQLWIMLCFNVTAGIAVIGVAKTMIVDIFGAALPAVVDGTFALAYVLLIGVFNMLGRLLWAGASDFLGRNATYRIILLGGIVLYLSLPFVAQQTGGDWAVAALVCFCVATMVLFTFYGGGFATIPAYLADLFGTRHVGGIHGRLLTAWSVAGLIGPFAITMLRERALHGAIHDVAATVDKDEFAETFGAGLGQLDLLIDEKSVTLAKLLEIAPPGTLDPTPGLYDSTMYGMALLLFLALVANALMKPVHPRHHLPMDEDGPTNATAAAPPRRRSSAGGRRISSHPDAGGRG